jgi:Flp pilus assembly protein TadG
MPSSGCASHTTPLRDRRGVAAVEFALAGGLLMLLVLGAVEAGRYLLLKEAVRTAAAEAVRIVAIRGSANMNAGASPCQGMSGDVAGAAARLPLLDAAKLAVTLKSCSTSGAVTRVAVEVKYSLANLRPLLPGLPAEIKEDVQAVIY